MMVAAVMVRRTGHGGGAIADRAWRGKGFEAEWLFLRPEGHFRLLLPGQGKTPSSSRRP